MIVFAVVDGITVDKTMVKTNLKRHDSICCGWRHYCR